MKPRIELGLLLAFLLLFHLPLTNQDSRGMLSIGAPPDNPATAKRLLGLTTLPASSSSISEEFYFNSTWGGNSYDYGRSAIVDSSRNIYVTGDTQSFGEGGRDVYILKFNSTGAVLWQKTWGGGNDDVGYGVSVDPSGNVYVTGYTMSFGQGLEDAFILKFNSVGDLEWQKTWGGDNWDRGLSITVDAFGNIYVTGYSLSYGYSENWGIRYSAVFLLKLDSAGELEWQRTWEETFVAQGGSALATDSSGNIYVAGYYGGFLLKFNSTGEVVWQKTWGSTIFGIGDQCFGLTLDSSGNILITGQTSSYGAGGRDVFILKLSSVGGLVWQKTWGGAGNDEGRGIVVDSFGQIYVAGFTNSFGAGDNDIFVLNLNSTDANADLKWQRTIGGIGDDEAFGIALDPFGDPVVVGYISEAPPYNVNSPSFALDTPTFSLATSSFPSSTPSASLGTPDGVVSTPPGGDEYSGNADAYLFMIPEFPQTFTLPLFMLATILAAVIFQKMEKESRRRKH